ncbi:Uncharacterised protein [uncultured archaeon]|nr:Uncharacterised protein [uncultured archaeon]
MRKTLKNILASSLIAGSLLFAGCGKNEKYVLINSRGWIVGEYDTKEEAEKVGHFNYQNIPFQVIEKSKVEEKPKKEESATLRPYYSDTKEDVQLQVNKNYRRIHQLQRANQSKINLPFNLEEFIFKCLPGKMLRDITFKKIDEDRTFYGKSYEDYIIGYENGCVSYDLDKDRVADVLARFEEGRNGPATELVISEMVGKKEMIFENQRITLEKGVLREIAYVDLDKDGILEVRIEFLYNDKRQFKTLFRRDLSAY